MPSPVVLRLLVGGRQYRCSGGGAEAAGSLFAVPKATFAALTHAAEEPPAVGFLMALWWPWPVFGPWMASSGRLHGFFCRCSQGPPKNLGIVAEQVATYPQKKTQQPSCSPRQRTSTTAAAQACHCAKCRWRLQKLDLSTKKPRLYYYHYVFIEPLKNNQGQPGSCAGVPACARSGAWFSYKNSSYVPAFMLGFMPFLLKTPGVFRLGTKGRCSAIPKEMP